MYSLGRASSSLVCTLCPPCTRSMSRVSSRAAHKILEPEVPRWHSPLRPGKLKALDEAVHYIWQDSVNLKKELAEVKAAYEVANKQENPDQEQLERYKKKIDILEIQSMINLPRVRYAFSTGKYPFSLPVYRHLTEQKWRNDGILDLLMERIYQMHVVPDLLPELHPNVDMRIQFPNPAAHRALNQRRKEKSKFYTVEPGTFLRPDQTRKHPRVSCTVFHTDPRLYTLFLLDPDAPDEATNSFQTYLHWMQPNISLSASRRNIVVKNDDHTLYIPPHPQQGTPYHRYVLLLLPHLDPAKPLNIPPLTDSQRIGFNLREFATQHGLALGNGGGAHMWREVWNEEVSAIYRDVFQLPEPIYKRPRKPDLYAGIQEYRKYLA